MLQCEVMDDLCSATTVLKTIIDGYPVTARERLDDYQESLETTRKTVDNWERPIPWVSCVSTSAHKPL